MLRAAALLVTSLLVSGCHPGNAESKRLRASCEAGDVAACNQFAGRLQTGEYVLQDHARAAALFDRACKGGIAEGCARFGGMLERGDGVKQDSTRALELYRQGCERGSMEGCSRLGVRYRDGRGVTR